MINATMPKGASTTHGRVSKASAKSQSLNAANIVALKREINTSARQPLQEVNNPPTRSARKATCNALDGFQENALIRWIREVKELYWLPTDSQISRSASQIHKRDCNNTVLKQTWTSQFIKRLPDDLKPSKPRLAKKKCLGPSDLETIQHWFDRLKPLIADVPPENIYNFDETNFQIGLTTRPRLYFTARADFVPPREWCEWITSIDCIAADGWAAGSYLVIQESSIDPPLDYQDVIDDIPDWTQLHETPNGRLTEELALDWLKVFHERTKDRVAEGQSRLLLFRGQPLFLTFNFLRFCEDRCIIPFCFPLNIAHLMQPFDLKHFPVYKKYSAEYWWHPEDPDEEKMDWLCGFGSMREENLTPDIIKRAFADRGIFPFNPSKLTGPLQEDKIKRPQVEEDSE
jgi:hypothetical protein